MADVMVMLGQFQFGLDTAAFQELNRNTEWRWPAQDVFDGRPVVQFTGWGEDTISLPGIIYPEYWGGTAQLDALRALGDTGQPQMLLDGRGNVLGLWVVTGVQERGSVFAQGGVARRQEFTVSLRRHHDGVAAVSSAAAISAASSRAAATAQAASVAANAAAKAAASMSAMDSALGTIQALVGTVLTPVQEALNMVGQAKSMAQALRLAATDSTSAISALGGITNLSTAQAGLGGLMRASSDASRSAGNASRVLGSTAASMLSAGDSPSAIATIQAARLDVNRMAVESASTRARSEDIVRAYQ